jgi:hypothetical protein
VKKPWQEGAVWEVTGWRWRGCEPPHPPPPHRWPRMQTQLRLKFTATEIHEFTAAGESTSPPAVTAKAPTA